MAGDLVISTINGQAIGTKNVIINGNFNVNQRGVSGTVTLAAGAYGHDRWKGGASGCTYTFATVENVTTLTISAGSLIQVVEGLNLQSGTYTLSFSGTAQGKIGAGSFSSSGVTGTATGGTNLNIEFNTGTLSLVQLEKGSTATSFEYRPYGTELQLCQRYLPAYQAVTVAGQALSTTTARFILPLPVTTRAYVSGLTNTISVGDIYVYTGGYTGAFNITAIAIAPGYLTWNNSVAFDVTIGTASFTTGALVAINFNPNTNKALVFTGPEL